MAFKVVTIADRISQYPDRRRLTKEDGSSELVTVAAEEGSVSAEGTEWGAAYANDLETRIDAETHLLEGNFGTVETTTTASKAYVIGDCLVLNGQLYKVIAAISKGATLVVGTNIAVHSVSAINSNLGGTTFSVDANGAYVHYTPTGGADPVVKKLGNGFELLWTNPSPSSAFAAQTLTLDLSKYKYIAIDSTLGSSYAAANNYRSFCITPIPSQAPSAGIANIIIASYSVSEVATRSITVSSNGIVFSSGNHLIQTGYGTDATYCIPLKIYGIADITS